MPQITLSPQVPDFFVEMDWRDRAARPAKFDADLVDAFEAAKVILLKNPPFEVDFELLSRVSFPAGRKYQKLRRTFLTRPKLYKPRVARAMYGAFGTDVGFYLKFRKAVNRLSQDLTDFKAKVFAGYRFLKRDISWRFTPTGPEGLHVDYVRSAEDLQYVRIFVNVDNAPRVWTLSYQLEELIERYFDFAGLAEMQGAHANEICNRLNQTVFSAHERLPGGPLPSHRVAFQPGEVWLCESRLNSHEIFSGRRMVGTHFPADPQTMRDPSLRVEARVARAMARHAPAARAVAE